MSLDATSPDMTSPAGRFAAERWRAVLRSRPMLTVAMIALVAVAGMESLATGISHTFLTVSATLGQHLQ